MTARLACLVIALGLGLGAVTADIHAAGPMPALKIAVEADGMYRLTGAQMRSAGFDPTRITPNLLELRHRGQEVAIDVVGGGDGVLDEDDYVVFYGEAMTGPFTERNVYWLTADQGTGRRMVTREVPPSFAPTATSFPKTAHIEEDKVYWQNPPPSATAEHWYWQRYLQAPDTTTVAFPLDPPATGGAHVLLSVGLQGRSDDQIVAPDHHTRISLNGTPVDEAYWDGQRAFQHQGTVPPSLLQDDSNTLSIEMLGDTGAEVDQVYVNWIEVEYQAAYVTSRDRLAFHAPAPGAHTFAVRGFTTPEVALFDISNPEAPVRLLGSVVTSDGQTYTLRFSDVGTTDARYLATTLATMKKPTALALDQPSNLRAPDNSADYLVITHPEFRSEVQRLASHRRNQGLDAQVVSVHDVYDEFSGGVFDPGALRQLLRYARANWATAPQYVLLVGDANMDYRDNLDTGYPNYVPTHLFDTWPLGETPNDDWFVQMDDDVVPDLSLGRLPARTPRDVRAMVDKIIAYESALVLRPWHRRALFVADDDLAAFEAISDELISLLPSGYVASRFYASAYSVPADPTADVSQAMGEGALLLSYLGHGATNRWGTWTGGRLFDLEDVDRLTNGDRLPLLVTGTCLNGFFAHPFEPYSLAEAFVRTPNGGAVAAWSPSGLGFPHQHRLLMGELFAALFQKGENRLGPAIAGAKTQAYARDPTIAEVLQTFVLFGDPALKLSIGTPLGHSPIFLSLLTR